MDKNDLDVFLRALEKLPQDIRSAKYAGAPKKGAPIRARARPVHDMIIDLHGVTRPEALSRVRRALEGARGTRRRILVITGRGNNSEGGICVLRKTIARFLETEGAAYILEFGYASPEFGGDGAFDIRTR